MTLLILHHLAAVTVVAGVALAVVLAYQFGFQHGRRFPVVGAAPMIRLVWAADIPVAVVGNPAQSVEVARWLDAAKEGTVLRV